MRLRVKDVWHPGINKHDTPWVYSDHPNFRGSLEEFLTWVAIHNGNRLDGVQAASTITDKFMEEQQENV